MAIVPDVMQAAASRRVRGLPDSAAGSVVLVRAAAVVRTDSVTAIDQGRAVAPVVPARARVRGVGLARVAVGKEAADQLDS